MRYTEKQRKWLTFEEAKAKLGDSMSSFVLFRCKRHMVLSPRFLGKVNEGIKKSLDSQLRVFCAELSGVLVAYDKISVLQTTGDIHDESPYLHFDIEADFIIFRPTIGCSLRGRINKISEDHIGCVVHGCSNASIPMPQKLVESGKFSGFDSYVVTSYRELEFEVTDITNNDRILEIKGKLKEDNQSLENINLEELYTKPSQNGLNNETPNSVGKDSDFFHRGSKKNKRKSEQSRDDSIIQNLPSEFKIDLQSDSSSSGKKKRKRNKNGQGERTVDDLAIKVEPEFRVKLEHSSTADSSLFDTTASSSGFFSSMPLDSEELDLSLGKKDSKSKKKKSKKKHKSDLSSDSLSIDTSVSSSGKKHKKKISHIKVEPL